MCNTTCGACGCEIMTDKRDVEMWLATLPEGSGVYIDDSGLTLRSDCSEAYMEIGGSSQEDVCS